jgi:hypothetical protein
MEQTIGPPMLVRPFKALKSLIGLPIRLLRTCKAFGGLIRPLRATEFLKALQASECSEVANCSSL